MRALEACSVLVVFSSLIGTNVGCSGSSGPGDQQGGAGVSYGGNGGTSANRGGGGGAEARSGGAPNAEAGNAGGQDEDASGGNNASAGQAHSGSAGASSGNGGRGGAGSGGRPAAGGTSAGSGGVGKGGSTTGNGGAGGLNNTAGQSGSAGSGSGCSHDCGGGACEKGRCQPVLLMDLDYNTYWDVTASDDEFLYFANSGFNNNSSYVAKLPKKGGDRIALVDEINGATSFMTQGGNLYFSAMDPEEGGHMLARVPIKGGPYTRLVSGHYAIFHMVVDKDSYYFADTLVICDEEQTACHTGHIYRGSLSGGAPVEIVHDELGLEGLFSDDQYLYWGRYETITETKNPSFSGIRRMPKAGGTPTTLLENEFTQGLILSNDGYFYWSVWGGDEPGCIKRMKKSGGAVEIIVPNQYTPMPLLVTNQHIYWTTDDEDRSHTYIYRAPLAGGAVEELYTTSGAYPSSMAIDAKYLYFDLRAKGVYRLAL